MNCIDFALKVIPDAPEGSFFTCPHSKLYRLKRGTWKLVRNPFLKRSIERQKWEAIKRELMRICAKAAGETVEESQEEADRAEYLGTSWPKKDPEGFEVNRVVGKATLKAGEDIKAGDAVELDGGKTNPKDWPRIEMVASVRATEDGLEQTGGLDVTLEGQDISTLDKAEAVRAAYQAEYRHLKDQGADTARVEHMVGKLDRFMGGHFERIPLTHIDGTYLTEDEIREEATKLNVDMALDVDGAGNVDVITAPAAEHQHDASKIDPDYRARAEKASGAVITVPPGTIKMEIQHDPNLDLGVISQAAATVLAREFRERGL